MENTVHPLRMQAQQRQARPWRAHCHDRRSSAGEALKMCLDRITAARAVADPTQPQQAAAPYAKPRQARAP